MDRRKFVGGLLAGSSLGLFPQFAWAQSSENASVIAGRYGSIPEPGAIHRIASAGPVADVFLISLVPDGLLGISTHNIADENKRYFPEVVRHLPNTGRIAGRGSTFPLERLVALRPDIVVDVGNTGETYMSTARQVAEQAGIPYIVVSGQLEQTDQQLRELGVLLGVPERGEQLAGYAHDILETTRSIRQLVEAQSQPRAKVFFGRGLDGLETGLSGSIHTEAIDFLGAHNVATAAGRDLIARVSMEQLVQWDPEVIVTQDANYFQRLKTDAVWQHISAVKNGRFYLAPSTPFGWLDHPPSINRLLGLSWFAHVLYPNLISYEKYAQNIITYFELFYGYSLTRDELAGFGQGMS